MLNVGKWDIVEYQRALQFNLARLNGIANDAFVEGAVPGCYCLLLLC